MKLMNTPRAGTISMLAVVLAAACGACAGMGLSLIDTGLSALRKTFLGAADKNYGQQYHDDFEKLLMTLHAAPPAPATVPPPVNGTTPPVAPPTTATPAPPPGPPGTTPPPPPPVVAVAGPLELEVVLLRERLVNGRSVPEPVADGDVLYDKFGTHGQGDNLKLSFRTNADCYVYVISIDSTAWAEAVFPSNYAGFTNPVQANKTYMIPEASQWLVLDSYQGTEHMIFLASRTPRPELEKSLVAVAAHTREYDASRAATDAEPKKELVAVNEHSVLARGFLSETRKSAIKDVPNSDGVKFSVDSQVFAAKGTGDIVVTRWFKHE